METIICKLFACVVCLVYFYLFEAVGCHCMRVSSGASSARFA